MFFQKNMDSKTSTLTGQFFLGRSEYGLKNFHLNWPNFFAKGGSMDSKMSTLVGPIFLLKKNGSTLSGPIFLRRSKSVSAVKDCNFDSPISFKNR